MKPPNNLPRIEGFYYNWNYQTNWQYSKYESKKYFIFRQVVDDFRKFLNFLLTNFFQKKRERICENYFFQNNLRQTNGEISPQKL
jgi:hypothetical protein